MKLVIDTNIIISALIRKGITRKMLFFPGLKLVTPEITFKEIKNHIDLIAAKSKLSKDNVLQILDILKKNIKTIPKSRWWNHYNQAENIIGKKDPKDVPFIAVALALTVDGIWSNDRDFESQSKFKIWKTAELAQMIGITNKMKKKAVIQK
ncbi:MAG: putative toxin-antitoxin system toxin component, PIN family [Candidatus Hodarchaeales archaeon]|jgi:putative PIN family toxin of toxin-antitoxin system